MSSTTKQFEGGGSLISSRLATAARRAATEHVTPFYLTDNAALAAAAMVLEAAFPDPWLRAYSLKADPNEAIVARLAARGWAANCVSLGEIAAARRAGVQNATITLEGIGKGNAELSAAVATAKQGDPLRWIAVESADEARALAASAVEAGLRDESPLAVLLRINPDIEPGTIDALAVGRGSSKFGMDIAETLDAARELGGAPGLQLIGIQMHAGSQLRDMSAWREAVARALSAYRTLADAGLLHEVALGGERGAGLGTLCVGGGMPVALHGDGVTDQPAVQAHAFRVAVDSALKDAARLGATPVRLAVEPGRALVATSTMLVARVLHVRPRPEVTADGTACVRQVVLDAGMTELIRPALYGAHHPVVSLASGAPFMSSVHGPICESTDALGAHELPEMIERNDLVMILGAGAYADAMWSPYNGRPRPARLSLESDGSLLIDRARATA